MAKVKGKEGECQYCGSKRLEMQGMELTPAEGKAKGVKVLYNCRDCDIYSTYSYSVKFLSTDGDTKVWDMYIENTAPEDFDDQLITNGGRSSVNDLIRMKEKHSKGVK